MSTPASFVIITSLLLVARRGDDDEPSTDCRKFFLFRTVLLSGKRFKGSHRTCEEEQINTLIQYLR